MNSMNIYLKITFVFIFNNYAHTIVICGECALISLRIELSQSHMLIPRSRKSNRYAKIFCINGALTHEHSMLPAKYKKKYINVIVRTRLELCIDKFYIYIFCIIHECVRKEMSKTTKGV